jgi:glycosyltransferase involved in cell wall biosynthesis
VIFHAWSAHAARWVLPLTAGHRPLLIQVDPAADLRELAGWATRENVQFVCASLATCARLRACGVPASRVAVIRPALERLTVEPVERARARGRLALRLDDEVILPLPPVARHTGTLFAAWATFLLEKARPRLRLVLPLGGREAARVQRLAAACRHEWMVSHVLADAPLPALLAAADVAVYLPRRDAPPEALCGARAANCRIVATDVPVVREVLDGAPGVWLCKPDDPADAARKLSAALDSGPPATPDAAQFPRPPTIGEVVLQYRQVYTRLATRRPAALPS